MTGSWVFVCGPSGAGKDSVIGWAQQRLASNARIVFARRMVTRAAAGADDEVSPRTLQSLRDAGKLRWDWAAHGHEYAIPLHYEQDVAAGRVVVVNGSREHVATLPAAPGLRRVTVVAPAHALRERLHLRGRDSADAVAQRMARNETVATAAPDLVIDNRGELARAGLQLQTWLLAVAHAPAGGVPFGHHHPTP